MRFLERGTDESNLVLIAIFSQCTPHELKAQENEIGVGDVRFAVVANVCNFPILPCLPHLPATHADLTGKAEQLSELVERHASTRLIHREQIHEIEMARVIAIDIVVPLEFPVILALVPVTARADAMQQAAIMQHGQVESAAVP